MKNNRIIKKYAELFSERTMDKTISKRLLGMEDDPDIDKLRELFCDKLLYKMTAGVFDCPSRRQIRNSSLFGIYEENVELLPISCSFHWMVYSLYVEDEEAFFKYFNALVKELKQSGKRITEKYIVDTLIIPLKDAVPDFWNKAYKKLYPICADKGTKELCKLMDKYYAAGTFDEALDPLLDFSKKYPEIVVAREFLAHTYEGLNRWEQEIAHLEGMTEAMFYSNCMEQYYFDLAWAYGKTKEYDKEEEYYRKAIAERRDTEFANNNLGWCLLKQKRYAEAEKVFDNCRSKRWDFPNSAEGYIRTLIKEGKNKEAKAFTKSFIEDDTYKLSESTIKEVESLQNKNTEPTAGDSGKGGVTKSASSQKSKHVKRMQFSSEKALEDELTAKLEIGAKIFGKKLKIYRRSGKYGRQFITSDGIIDLLCEDYKGDLYVIELKKDSGYKDAYEQVLAYMECLSKEKEFKNKNIYGIICLNSPPEALKKKVRKDDRVSLYEYHIDYSEII